MNNIVIIGLGRQGQTHLKAAREMRNLSLLDEIYVCDLDIKDSRKLAKANDVIFIETLEQCPSNNSLFVVATPNSTHQELLTEISQRSPHSSILKEKPSFIVNKQSTSANPIYTAQQRYFNSSYIEARKDIERIGKIHFCDYLYTLNDKEESWYWDSKKGGGCLLNIGWHFTFIALWFFGSPEQYEIRKLKTDRRSWKYNTDDTVFMNLHYKDFFIRSYMSVSDSTKQDSFRIIGEKGTIDVNKKHYILYDIDGNIVKYISGDEDLSYVRQISAVMKCDPRLDTLEKHNHLTGEVIYENS